MSEATWWAPTGTPPPRDMDTDGVPVSLGPDGATRWELISATPGFLLPPPGLNLGDILPEEDQ